MAEPHSPHAAHPHSLAAPAGRSATGVGMQVLLGVMLVLGSAAVDIHMAALPALSAALHAPQGAIHGLLGGYLAGFALGQLLWSLARERLGGRGVAIIGLLVFALGSAGCALSANAYDMMGWRVIQALGAGAGPVVARAVLRERPHGTQSPALLSVMLITLAVAPLLAPCIGISLIRLWDWRGLFWALCGLSGLAALAALRLPTATERGTAGQPGAGIASSYRLLLRSPLLLFYSLAGGLFYGGIFAFIGGTQLDVLGYYQEPPRGIVVVFGLGMAAIIAVNLINPAMLRRFGADRLLQLGTAFAAFAGVTMALEMRLAWGGMPGLLVLLFLCLAMGGFMLGTVRAGALTPYAQAARAAPALAGAIQFGAGLLIALVFAWGHAGMPWPWGGMGEGMVAAGGLGGTLAALISFTLALLPWPGLP